MTNRKFEDYEDFVAARADELVADEEDSLLEELLDGLIDIKEYFKPIVEDQAEQDVPGFNLQDAADILNGSSYEETDVSLWEDAELPEEALEIKAKHTYCYDLEVAVLESAESLLVELEQRLLGTANDLEAEIDRVVGEQESIQDEINDYGDDDNNGYLEDLEEEFDELLQEESSLQEDLHLTNIQIDNLQEVLDSL